MPEQISLSVIMGHYPRRHSVGAWHGAGVPAPKYSEPEYSEHAGRKLAHARVELLLPADRYGVHDMCEGSGSAVVRHVV